MLAFTSSRFFLALHFVTLLHLEEETHLLFIFHLHLPLGWKHTLMNNLVFPFLCLSFLVFRKHRTTDFGLNRRCCRKVFASKKANHPFPGPWGSKTMHPKQNIILWGQNIILWGTAKGNCSPCPVLIFNTETTFGWNSLNIAIVLEND